METIWIHEICKIILGDHSNKKRTAIAPYTLTTLLSLKYSFQFWVQGCVSENHLKLWSGAIDLFLRMRSAYDEKADPLKQPYS